MHYKGFLITEQIPNGNEISCVLEEYREDNEDNSSGFEWDWYSVGGRYCGGLKINTENQYEINTKYELNFLNKKRNNKLFFCKILDELEESVKYYDEREYLNYIGLKDECLYVDGAYYDDLKDFDITQCYLVVAKDYFNVREKWNGNNWIGNSNFEEEIKKLDLKGKFITIIDFHN